MTQVINQDANLLARPLRLPCGSVLKNRLVKSAMSDSLGDGAGNPTQSQMRLYERWAEGGVAMSLIGEVQITPHYPEKPGNLVFGPKSNRAALTDLAARGSQNGAQIWPQLGHAGALSYAPISMPKGPSSLDLDGLVCEELTLEEIQALPADYAAAAYLAKTTGFSGVEIHAGHGFLLSQFLSPLFNHRTDAYGGDVAARFRIIGEVTAAVREAVGPDFPIGIKINSTDMLEGGLTGAEALDVVRFLDQSSVDLIDVSGGTYFPGAPSSSDGRSVSGPYFVDFARKAKQVTSVPIMLTGGFQTEAQARAILAEGVADVVSVARVLVLNPELANAWVNGAEGSQSDPDFPVFEAPPPGAITAWYSMRLTALGEYSEAGFNLSATDALAAYDARDAARCGIWRAEFGLD